MRWAKRDCNHAVSDSNPPYKVAQFVVDGQVLYRASVQGEFIGEITTDPKEAQAICERHFLIMDSAQGDAA